MPVAVPASTTYVPARQDLASMTSEVLAWIAGVQSDEELKAIARDGINLAIDKINSRIWEQLSNRQTITLVADTDEYDVNSNFKKPRRCFRLNSDSERDGRVYYQDYQALLDRHEVATASGSPDFYSIDWDRRKFLLVVPPSSAFVGQYPTLRLDYYRRIPRLVDDGEVLDAPPEFRGFCIWYARENISGIRAPGKYAMARAERQECWKMLKVDDRDTMSDWDNQ